MKGQLVLYHQSYWRTYRMKLEWSIGPAPVAIHRLSYSELKNEKSNEDSNEPNNRLQFSV